mmetsp:Transcript_16831/g.38801  ORF Transcript_16831/g.38801 Transcript_16831/m.38801 type:complete len:260 (-) Transcript_16831:509-1288(-)
MTAVGDGCCCATQEQSRQVWTVGKPLSTLTRTKDRNNTLIKVACLEAKQKLFLVDYDTGIGHTPFQTRIVGRQNELPIHFLQEPRQVKGCSELVSPSGSSIGPRGDAHISTGIMVSTRHRDEVIRQVEVVKMVLERAGDEQSFPVIAHGILRNDSIQKTIGGCDDFQSIDVSESVVFCLVVRKVVCRVVSVSVQSLSSELDLSGDIPFSLVDEVLSFKFLWEPLNGSRECVCNILHIIMSKVSAGGSLYKAGDPWTWIR